MHNTEAKSSKRKPIIGCADSSDLKSIPKTAHVHVSRLDPSTKDTDIVDYVKSLVSQANCVKLVSRNPALYASFKLSVPLQEVHRIMDASVWPSGISVNRFFFKRTGNPRFKPPPGTQMLDPPVIV